jgi:hypothetical protein
MNLAAGATIPVFSTISYQINSGITKLVSIQDTVFSQVATDAPNIRQTSFEYNPATFYKKKESTQTSDLRLKQTIYRYINDKAEVSGLTPGQSSTLDQMISANRLNSELETLNYTDSKLTSSLRQLYDTFPTGTIYASVLSGALQGNPLDEKTRITQYDVAGNILERIDRQLFKTAYLWGYNKVYPIAEIKNSAVKNTFYESFEEGNGNSAVNDSRTGHLSHNGPYNKTINGLDAGSYILRYWQKSGGSWGMITTPVTIPGTTYTINLNNLNVQIDDVCFYPQDAEMATFTYDPLIGMTSSTDAKGLTTFFEYDSFQRLKNIKDKDGYIIKHIDYHYQGQ